MRSPIPRTIFEGFRMSKPQLRYIQALLAAKADEDHCCFISGGEQPGVTVLYRGERWHVLQHSASMAVSANHIALVTLDEEAGPDKLNAVALAMDSEYEPLWLVDVRAFDDLAAYGPALRVLWRSDRA